MANECTIVLTLSKRGGEQTINTDCENQPTLFPNNLSPKPYRYELCKKKRAWYPGISWPLEIFFSRPHHPTPAKCFLNYFYARNSPVSPHNGALKSCSYFCYGHFSRKQVKVGRLGVVLSTRLTRMGNQPIWRSCRENQSVFKSQAYVAYVAALPKVKVCVVHPSTIDALGTELVALLSSMRLLEQLKRFSPCFGFGARSTPTGCSVLLVLSAAS